MYEEDRENREDRDQEIERTEIMDDVDEQETQTSSSRSQENRKSGSSQNVNWTTPNRSSERTSSERKTQWQESKQQNNRPEHGYRNEYRETVQAPRKKNSWARKAAGITAAAVLFGTVAGGVMTGVNYVGARLTGLADITATAPAETEGTTTAQVPETSAASNNGSTTAVSTVTDVSSIAEKAMPSLVAINDTMTVEQNNFFGMPQTYQAQSSGSGIIVGQNDTELLIATNNHVVSGATDMKVTFTDSTQVAAAVKGTDSATDLAIIAVKLSDIPSDTMSKIKVATLGNSDNVKVGQQVIAIGNALGYGQSLTVGYISALDREITDENGIQHTYIQTDVAINPGNSGGALVNMQGELIGINTAKYSDTSVEGMGYALPISDVQDIINDLIAGKNVSNDGTTSGQAYLGISAQTITSQYAQLLNMPEGVYISSVEQGSAAEECGLQSGDIICSLDGEDIADMETFHDKIVACNPGDKVSIVYYRNNNGNYEKQTATATLKEKQ